MYKWYYLDKVLFTLYMKKNCLRGLFLAASVAFTLSNASALTISPARVELTADGGETVQSVFTIINTDEVDQTYYTSAENFESKGVSNSPTFSTSTDGLSSWIKIAEKVTVKKGERLQVKFSVVVPKDASMGGHYAAIFLRTTPSLVSADQTTVGAKVGILVFLKVLSTTTSSCINLTKNLSKGQENTEVTSLQQFLLTTGYITTKPSGYFGASTVTALKKFQIASGMSPIGSVGAITRGKVKEMSCATSTQNNDLSKKDVTQVLLATTSVQSNATKTPQIAKPTLTISAKPLTAEVDKTATITWKSQNTKECYLLAKGQNAGRGRQKRDSNGEQEIVVGSSLVTVTVDCLGTNGDTITKDIFVRIKPEIEQALTGKENQTGVKRYEIYLGAELILAAYFTKAEAMNNCVDVYHKTNPTTSIECLWGDEKIYSYFSPQTISWWKSAGVTK